MAAVEVAAAHAEMVVVMVLLINTLSSPVESSNNAQSRSSGSRMGMLEEMFDATSAMVWAITHVTAHSSH